MHLYVRQNITQSVVVPEKNTSFIDFGMNKTMCSCIRLEQPYARLVLPTFAAGSDVSVVIK